MLRDFRKAFSRVTHKIAQQVAAPKQPEAAEEVDTFTPLNALPGGTLGLSIQPERAAAYFASQARDLGAWEVHLANKASESPTSNSEWPHCRWLTITTFLSQSRPCDR